MQRVPVPHVSVEPGRAVADQTDRGGDRLATVGDINVFGNLAQLKGKTTNVTGTFVVSGVAWRVGLGVPLAMSTSASGVSGVLDGRWPFGAEVTFDEAYVRESLLRPQARAQPGYPPSMPSFDGLLRDAELDARG